MNKLDDADDIAFIKAQIARIRPLAYEMRQWPDHDTNLYSWDAVANCMFKYPEKVEFDYDLCPDCNQPRFRVFCDYKYSYAYDLVRRLLPPHTVMMAICPMCKRQIESDVFWPFFSSPNLRKLSANKELVENWLTKLHEIETKGKVES